MTEKDHHPTPALRTTYTSVDVARKAGVSRTTVSYVLNGNGTGHVSEETRKKVLQAAEDLGYSTHNSAQALRKGKSDEICIVVDLPLSAHRTELLVSVQRDAFQHGYTPVAYFCYGFSAEQMHTLLLKIFARRPIGIFATASSMTTKHLALAQRMGVDNIVLYSVEPLEHARTILLPTQSLGRLAAGHLLERGHRHLGLVQPADRLDAYGFEQRLEGMRAVIAGMPGVCLDILPLPFTLADAHALVETALTGADRPTGIYAYNDEYALLLLGALADRGKQVPRDVAVVGTDDISCSAWMRPTLTTIRFDSITIAQRAVEMLVRRHTGQPLPEELCRPLMPQLIARGST
ncbi:MAG: LacI family DNA-binding transcriptional regulator [Ktedonobacteraceae bacterium]